MIKAFGIAFRFHPLFVLLMVMSVATGYFAELLTLFALVFIHELGHVVCARYFGWKVREVQLLPFGGVAVVDDAASVPTKEELLVALAGPLQNGWMIVFAWIMRSAGVGDPAWWDYFMQANAMIGLFNLLPIQPLDGGKVLLCLLGYWFSFHPALVWSARISLLLSALMVAASLVPLGSGGIGLNTLIVGLFLLYSNWYAYRHLPFQFLRFLIGREKQADRRRRSGPHALPIVVSAERPVGEVVRLLKRERYHLIYVVGRRGAVGKVLPEEELIRRYLGPAKQRYTLFDAFMYNKK